MELQNAVETVIRPNRGWLFIDWGNLVHYRDLLYLLVKRNFVAQYKQTILGPLWFIIQPLLTTLVFTVIFGKVARISTDGMPPVLFYLCGLVIWRYFADCLSKNATSFIANANLFGKVYFPRLVVPLSVVVSNLFTFLIQLGTFLGFFVYFKFFTQAGELIRPNAFILVLPLLVLQTAFLGLGIGLWMSSLTAKYRDLSHLMLFLVQLWMYATPIIYPFSLMGEKWKLFIAMNPMTPVVELFRYAFLGASPVDMRYVLVSVFVTLILLLSGVVMFNKVERTFIDTV